MPNYRTLFQDHHNIEQQTLKCCAPSPFGRLRRPTGCAGGRTRWGSHRPCFPSNN